VRICERCEIGDGHEAKDRFKVVKTHTATYSATYTATHCNTLQHTVTHCKTLQQQEMDYYRSYLGLPQNGSRARIGNGLSQL